MLVKVFGEMFSEYEMKTMFSLLDVNAASCIKYSDLEKALEKVNSSAMPTYCSLSVANAFYYLLLYESACTE